MNYNYNICIKMKLVIHKANSSNSMNLLCRDFCNSQKMYVRGYYKLEITQMSTNRWLSKIQHL